MLMTFVAGHLASNTLSTLAAFQAQDSINSGNSKLLMIFIGLAAIALITQAGGVVFMALKARKAQQELTSHFIELKEKALPLIATSHSLVTELTPEIREITSKIGKIAAQVEKLSLLVNEKAEEFSPTISAANRTAAEANQTAQEINLKARAQVSRINGMVTTALDATARLGVAIEKGITVPGREVAGILSGLKVGFDNPPERRTCLRLRRPARRSYNTPSNPASPHDPLPHHRRASRPLPSAAAPTPTSTSNPEHQLSRPCLPYET